MKKNISSIGKHYTLDVFECRLDKINYCATIEKLLNQIVDILELTKVGESYKQFEPVGVTGFILLEESHVSIHTWPEHQFAAIDIFSCRTSLDIDKIKSLLEQEFETPTIKIQSIQRGVPSLET